MLAQLKSEYPDVQFLSLTVEEKDDRATVQSWLDKAGASGLTTGKASTASLEKLRSEAKAQNAIPATVFVTPEGNVVQYLVGARGHDEMKRYVDQIRP